MAANDGIRRGDSERTGDLEAKPSKTSGRSASGMHATGDGPAGTPTVDPSARELGSDTELPGMDEAEGLAEPGSGALEDLTIVSEDDPSLGLTNHGDRGPDDWAADTGPSRNPEGGAVTGRLRDDSSTLGPKR